MANSKKGNPSNVRALAGSPGGEVSPLISYPPRAFNVDSVDLAHQAIEQFLACRPIGFPQSAPEELQAAWWTIIDTDSSNGALRARFDFEYDRMPRRVSKGVASIILTVKITQPSPRKIFVSSEWKLKGSFTQYPGVLEQAIKISQFSVDLLSNILYELSRQSAAPKVVPSSVSHLFRKEIPWYMPDPDENEPEPEPDLSPLWVPRNGWPTMQEYNEAVQSPRLAFEHEELRDGEVECNKLGLPKAISGGFASVYKVIYKGRAWAVRCFNTPVRDHAQRYKRVSERIAKAKVVSSFTRFEFMEEGIKVAGHWFPIVMMEWVYAAPLNQFIEENLHDSATLMCFRANFRTMLAQLAGARIAHGDLQHGNILVQDCTPILVDYDSMFVDALIGRESIEVGHRNYQHPGRSKSHFGPYMDNFSGWLIDTALLALITEPDLWSRCSGGGENLLFTHRDLTNPSGSWLFQHLINHRDKALAAQAKRLLEFLSQDPAVIPLLEGVTPVSMMTDTVAPQAEPVEPEPPLEDCEKPPKRSSNFPDWMELP